MKRKLIKQGSGGLTICLPKKWTEKNKLKAGEEINLLPEEDKLIISGKGISEQRTTKLTITKASKTFTKSMISNAYKKGYDTIRVVYDDESMYPIIESVVHELLGHEIMDKKTNNVLIKNVSVELEQEYLNLLRKSFFLCKENIKIIVEDIKQNKYPNKEKVQEYRDLVTKYTDYCKRIIVKNQKQKDYEMFAYLIVWNLEKMSNEFNYLYRYLADFQPKVDKNTVKHLAMSFRMFEQIMEHYFKKDVSYLRLFSKVKDQFMYKELEKLLHSKKLNPNIMHRVANIVRRCNDIMGPFCGRYL